MAQKLVYTSAPKGLKPGAFGFCTVACSRTLTDRTIEMLERLSVYRRLQTEDGGTAAPVVFSHLLVEDGGTTKRVLSRVSASGVDYSGRENKIACHYVLDAHDLVVPGPAAVCDAPDFFVKEWRGEPQYFDRSIAMPPWTDPSVPCDEWKRVAGDPGWAGVLASSAFSGQNILLVVDTSIDVLRLFREAIGLLPSDARWDATFSTYYMKTIPGVRCQWKAVYKDSPEEFGLRALKGQLVFDLTEPEKLHPLSAYEKSSGVAKLIAEARGVPAQEPSEVVLPTAAPPVERRESVQVSGNKISNGRRVEFPTLPESSNEVETGTASSDRKNRKKGRPVYRIEIKDPEASGRELRKRSLWTRCAFYGGIASVLIACVLFFVWAGATQTSLTDSVKNIFNYGKAVNELAKEDAPSVTGVPEGGLFDFDDDAVPNENDMFATGDVVADEEKPAKPKAKPQSKKETTPAPAKSKSKSKPEAEKTAKPAEQEPEPEPDADSEFAEESEPSDPFSFSSTSSRSSDDEVSSTSDASAISAVVSDLDSGMGMVDFNIFSESEAKGARLRADYVGELSANLQAAYKVLKKTQGSVSVTLDLSGDPLRRRVFDNGGREQTKTLDMSEIVSGEANKIEFSLNDPTGKDKGTFAVVIAGEGLFSVAVSDVKTRDYLLSCAKISWSFDIRDGGEYASKPRQLLKPARFEPDKNIGVGFLNNFVKAYGESTYDICSEDSYAKTKKRCVLLVKLLPGPDNSVISENDVESTKLYYELSNKLPGGDNVSYMFFVFSKKSLRVQIDKYHDKDVVAEELMEYYEDRERRALEDKQLIYHSSPDGEILERAANLTEKQMKQIKKLVDGTYRFKFYFVVFDASKTLPQESEWIVLGETTNGPATNPEPTPRGARKRHPLRRGVFGT